MNVNQKGSGKDLRFVKMHGAGNDYVFVDGFAERRELDWSDLARRISDRHYGVGSDGLVLIGPAAEADLTMRMFNADGSEAEMCGNAIRCVAKYAYEHGLCEKTDIRVDTPAGRKLVTIRLSGRTVVAARVAMGRPEFRRSAIPMTGDPQAEAVETPLEVDDASYTVTCLSMGNPHCVIFTPDVDAVPLARLGPAVEHHPAFPNRTNVHFAHVAPPGGGDIMVRTWERGSGATLACGTGASAVCAAAARTERAPRTVNVHMPGGTLLLEWADSGEVFMTGPAVEVFTGLWPLS